VRGTIGHSERSSKLLKVTTLVSRVFGNLVDRVGFVEESCGFHGLVSWVQIRSRSCTSCSGMLRELRCASPEACWTKMRSCEGV
jgi:hypothetical protein